MPRESLSLNPMETNRIQTADEQVRRSRLAESLPAESAKPLPDKKPGRQAKPETTAKPPAEIFISPELQPFYDQAIDDEIQSAINNLTIGEMELREEQSDFNEFMAVLLPQYEKYNSDLFEFFKKHQPETMTDDEFYAAKLIAGDWLGSMRCQKLAYEELQAIDSKGVSAMEAGAKLLHDCVAFQSLLLDFDEGLGKYAKKFKPKCRRIFEEAAESYSDYLKMASVHRSKQLFDYPIAALVNSYLMFQERQQFFANRNKEKNWPDQFIEYIKVQLKSPDLRERIKTYLEEDPEVKAELIELARAAYAKNKKKAAKEQLRNNTAAVQAIGAEKATADDLSVKKGKPGGNWLSRVKNFFQGR